METLSYQISANAPENPSVQTMLFVHGWPDDETLWHKQIEFFSSSYRCVTVTLPNFGSSRGARAGYDFPALIQLLVNTIHTIEAGRGSSGVIVVGHDWGAYLAYLLESRHPELVDKLITLDVGGDVTPSGPGHALFFAAYQGWLISAWLLGKRLPSLGNLMSRKFAKLAGAPRVDSVHSAMNYPYYYAWRGYLNPSYRSSVLYRYKPQRPLLYLYGLSKTYMFHSERWLRVIEKTPQSRVVGIPRAGHWLMRSQPDAVNAAIEQWLN